MDFCIDFFGNLLYGSGVAHSMIILALIVGIGVYLSRIKIAGISFGVTWVLFIGILFSHYGMTLDSELLHFVKEFGLILFVYSIGLQVGPGFFSSFKSGGLKLNTITCIIVLFDVLVALLLIFTTDESVDTITGIMSGAVTNTPGMGAASTTFKEMNGYDSSNIVLGYSVAYPLGVIGCILAIIAIRFLYKGERRFSRDWAVFDMFPTILASIGCEIEGDRLGIGTNLFSERDTVFEEFGVDYVNDELVKRSNFYNFNIRMFFKICNDSIVLSLCFF